MLYVPRAGIHAAAGAAVGEQPTFVAAGAGVGAASSGSVNVDFPAGLANGDVLLLHCQTRSNSENDSVDTPTGWTPLHSGISTITRARLWSFWKRSDGTETGSLSVSFTLDGGVSAFGARMYAFRNVEAGSSFVEDGSLEEAADDGPGDGPTVTAGGDKRLAVCLIQISNDVSISEITGESGGDWTEPVAEFSTTAGSDLSMGIQTAGMPTGGTISGGTTTFGGGLGGGWSIKGFALKPG